ncbi:hypothetical protein RY831_19090 [Noviherbaspirillum sp. CPCC 100848]|uniref:Uncharacterized protein n=1 Tax=Noviherbaspirillum album TaxID=3080276 RepID=A0ABU6JCK2_9BURK|nr:hypothetical protein [Noviherbaspirillum sp. CPCC 100848]MEC4721275.1 hypothetical protein [Noviherbaspirillum sp. CPCC 100848]
MKALSIKDLSLTSELDARAMTSVRGGTGYAKMPSLFVGPLASFSRHELNFGAGQLLGQEQNTLVNNGNNVAFASGIKSNVNPTQTGKNTINFMS